MKFSVIVPVYGVERYLDACVESVLAQTCDDFELILVDDCSPDGCPAMCDAWAQKDPRIRVIHKEINEGVGFARNTGLESARGDFVMFVDSDDYISPDLFGTCSELLGENVDILTFGAEFVYENKHGGIQWIRKQPLGALTADSPEKKAELFAMLCRCKLFQYPWNKFYRRALLMDSNARFAKISLMEDFFFNIGIFSSAKYICAVEQTYYCYRKPAHDTLASRYYEQFFAFSKKKYEMERQFLRDCHADGEVYAGPVMEGYINHVISAIIRNRAKSAKLTGKQQMERIRAMLTDSVTKEVLAEYVPVGMKYKLICGCMRAGRVWTLLVLSIGVEFLQQRLLPWVKRLLNR